MVVTIMSIWFYLYLVLCLLEEHVWFPKFPKHTTKVLEIATGKSPRNRDHEAHCSINFCSALERRPRFLGGCQRGGGT